MSARLEKNPNRIRWSPGFGMVEVLIGMVMGLITIGLIAKVFATFEGSKRTTMTGADAQTNGILALRTLEKEIRQGGYGLVGSGAALCPSAKKYHNGTGAATEFSTVPVKITDGGTGSDSVDVIYSASSYGVAPMNISVDMPTPSNKTNVNTVAGLSACDFVLMASPDGSKQCTLAQATSTQSGNNVTSIFFLTGSGASNYNPPGGFNGQLYPAGGYTTSDKVYNLGNLVSRRFEVVKTTNKDEYFLRQTNLLSAASGCGTQIPLADLDLISNVVNIQARYGVAASGNQEVECWTNAVDLTGVASGPNSNVTATNNSAYCFGKNWASPSSADVNRIKAVRLAIVVRSNLPEKPSTVGGSCDATSTAPTSWDGGPAISLTTITNWQCYRYKVYQTTIPIMNVIWANI